MKKAFTLVEMLIVVVVLVTLMSIAFRLSSIGSDQYARNETISRMQRLENCVSGYYAAFGSYPPVKLHGTRDYGYPADGHGIQQLDKTPDDNVWNWEPDKFRKWVNSGFSSSLNQQQENDAWRKVEAACRSQPVGCNFPFSERMNNYVKARSRLLQKMVETKNPNYSYLWNDQERKKVIESGFDDGVTDNRGRHSKHLNDSNWADVQLFRFGLMSFLLPRYLLMPGANEEMLRFKQWTDNNKLPCNPYTGVRYANWQTVRNKVFRSDGSAAGSKQDLAEVESIASQSVCARWMPNLQNICSCTGEKTVFGIKLRAAHDADSIGGGVGSIYSPDGEGSTSDQYVLDGITVVDGWNQEFYYYSPSPNQTYTLWSAGPNKRTFPPWIDRAGKFSSASAPACIEAWTEDDIIHMSN